MNSSASVRAGCDACVVGPCALQVSVFSAATMSMDSAHAKACFKAKARACAYVVEWLSEEITPYHVDSELNQFRATCMWCYNGLFQLFREGRVILNPQEIQRTEFLIDCLLYSHNRLASAALNVCSLLWVLKPKHHYLFETKLHVRSTAFNPGAYWCFGDEDHVGVISKLALRCHKRTAVLQCIRRYMIRYRLRLFA